jgi:hypothetical protein
MEGRASTAVKVLRKQKLMNGFHFMINCNELPSNQCYLEYPNGSIQLVCLSKMGHDFDFIRELDLKENKNLRAKFKLPIIDVS